MTVSRSIHVSANGTISFLFFFCGWVIFYFEPWTILLVYFLWRKRSVWGWWECAEIVGLDLYGHVKVFSWDLSEFSYGAPGGQGQPIPCYLPCLAWGCLAKSWYVCICICWIGWSTVTRWICRVNHQSRSTVILSPNLSLPEYLADLRSNMPTWWWTQFPQEHLKREETNVLGALNLITFGTSPVV